MDEETREYIAFVYKDGYGFEYKASSTIDADFEFGETQLGEVIKKFHAFLIQCGFVMRGNTLISVGVDEDDEYEISEYLRKNEDGVKRILEFIEQEKEK